MDARSELVSQKLEAHDLTGAIEVAITEADEAKVLAVQAIAKIDDGLSRLNNPHFAPSTVTRTAWAGGSQYYLLI